MRVRTVDKGRKVSKREGKGAVLREESRKNV